METIDPILEKIRPLIADLNAQERLALIQAIAEIDDSAPAERSTSDRQRQIASEQAAWFALPQPQRQQYQGQYVAVKDSQVIDSDRNQRTLYLRIRDKFGREPVAILNAAWETAPSCRY